MFPHVYWPPRYWPGRYWPPAGALVIRLPERLWARLLPGNLVAVVSLTTQLGAILTDDGVLGARLELDEVDTLWLAATAPPTAELVRGDAYVALVDGSLAVQVPVVYASAELVAELLGSRLDDGAIISVVSRDNESVTLKPE